MSAEVKILIEGFTNTDSLGETGEEETQPTITLVRDGDLVIVVDPGILSSQKILIDALKEEGLDANDVNIVCITHSHLDHYRNIGMFPEAKTLEYFGLWNKNTVQDWPKQFTPNIQILKTPGHDYTGITLFVNTEDGVVAICGDVFWKENYPEDPQDDRFASDPEKLKESREKVLKKADWIIPGHAGIYKTKEWEASEEKNSPANLKKKEPKFLAICRNCRRTIKKPEERCECSPSLCYRCCECHLDCDLCSCSHKK